MTPMPPSMGFENENENENGHQPYDDWLGSCMPLGEGVRKPSSTEACVAGSIAILRLINTIVAESFPVAENEAPPATFPTSVLSRDKS
jgi:hypothetical protein